MKSLYFFCTLKYLDILFGEQKGVSFVYGWFYDFLNYFHLKIRFFVDLRVQQSCRGFPQVSRRLQLLKKSAIASEWGLKGARPSFACLQKG